jgi:hypothetical protein
MTWKSTAVVSGIGLLATWVASVPPPSLPGASTQSRPQVNERAASSATSDIARQAERLQVRLRTDSAYEQPSRNLFRFGSSAAPKAPSARTAPQPTPDPPVTPPPAALQISLSGIAGDMVEGQEQRTAILSTPTGILLVRKGDEVAGQFRVGAIDTGAVELVRLDDGGVLRLTLKP